VRLLAGLPVVPLSWGRHWFRDGHATCKLLEPYFSPLGLAGISGFGVDSGLDLVVLGWSRLPRGGGDRYSNRFDLNSTLIRP